MLKPLGDRVVLKKDEAKTQTESGLFLTSDSISQEAIATVVSVGHGVSSLELHGGVRVVYKEYSVTDITVEDEDLLLIKEEDILAVLTK